MIFEVERDELGNEVYVGAPITVNPYTKQPTSAPVQPTYNTPLAPKTTNPTPASLNVEVREGLNLVDAKRKVGEIFPGRIEGWQDAQAAIVSDDVNAYTDAPGSGYSDELVLSLFDTSEIPPGAIITGVRVIVERSKI